MIGRYLWDVASAGSTNILVAADLCKRVRFRGSSCQKCLDICPENAISLDPGPSISNGCSDCGLCQVACPTEVFQNQLQTDQYLLNQTADLLRRDPVPGERRRLVVRCREAEGSEENALSVACLGRVNENIILGAALLGFEEILLLPGTCSQCRLSLGENLFSDSIRSSRVLLGAVGLERVTVDVGDGDDGRIAILERRDVLRSFANSMKSHLGSFVYSRERAIRQKLSIDREREDSARTSPRRTTLLRLLEQRQLRDEGVVNHEDEFPWGVIRIDEERCAACGICAALCPTGAILEESKDDCVTLCFQSSACTNCSLCMEACPENAVDFEESFSIAEVFDAEDRVAVRVEVDWCAVCGEEIRAGKGKRCPTCEKRQIRPQTLKV